MTPSRTSPRKLIQPVVHGGCFRSGDGRWFGVSRGRDAVDATLDVRFGNDRIGLDGAVGLTSKIQEIITQATILIGSSRHLSYFESHPAPKFI